MSLTERRAPVIPPSRSPETAAKTGQTAPSKDGPGEIAPGQPLFGSTVADVMVRNVVTTTPEATLRTAALLLAHKRISGLPVVDDDDHVVGVLSEKDIVHVLQQQNGLKLPGGLFDLLLELSEARQKDMLARFRRVLDETTVKSAMSAPPQTISSGAPTIEAIWMMAGSHINRLPVVEGERLVGIVSRRDVLVAHVEPA
jgi:CBS domain-containing protein